MYTPQNVEEWREPGNSKVFAKLIKNIQVCSMGETIGDDKGILKGFLLPNFLQNYANSFNVSTTNVASVVKHSLVYSAEIEPQNLKVQVVRQFDKYLKEAVLYPIDNPLRPYEPSDKVKPDGFWSKLSAKFSFNSKHDYWREMLSKNAKHYSRGGESFGDVQGVIDDLKELANSKDWKVSDDLDDKLGARNYKLINECLEVPGVLEKFFIAYACDKDTTVENCVRMIYLLTKCSYRNDRNQLHRVNLNVGRSIFQYATENKELFENNEEGVGKFAWSILLANKMVSLELSSATSNLYSDKLNNWLVLSNAFNDKTWKEVVDCVDNLKFNHRDMINFEGVVKKEAYKEKINLYNFLELHSFDNLVSPENRQGLLEDIKNYTYTSLNNLNDIQDFDVKDFNLLVLPNNKMPWLKDKNAGEYKAVKDLSKLSIFPIVEDVVEVTGEILSNNKIKASVDPEREFTNLERCFFIHKDISKKSVVKTLLDTLDSIYEEHSANVKKVPGGSIKRQKKILETFNQIGFQQLVIALDKKNLIDKNMENVVFAKEDSESGNSFKL